MRNIKITKQLIAVLMTGVFIFVTGCASSESITSTKSPQDNAGGTTAVSTEAATEVNSENNDEDSNTESTQNSDLIGTYQIVDTGVTDFYSDTSKISQPLINEAFYGQDADFQDNMPTYTDNEDGTITDKVTGLMWQQTMDAKMTFDDSFIYAENSNLAGYEDWRMPTIKELWSLMIYTGQSGGETAKILFIDTDYFNQPIGDTSKGEREIDAQVWSSTEYVGTTMKGDSTVFGVNFIDGRIKGYGKVSKKTQSSNEMYVRLVRGNLDYGINNFEDNQDGTISDLATGLMWQASDDGETRNWEEALSYAQTAEDADYEDWRLPSAKELQSIVDYSRSPQTTNSAAIDAMFELTQITDTKGAENYGFYWTSTTHLDGRNIYDGAAYVAFGEALGQMNDTVLDVHGAGALRSDPKSGNADDYPKYQGPQGDIQYVYNFTLLVRNINE